ncbi:MAG: hypothetical protein H0V62_12685 [Gammaproteobacteria bacterium]|nr:hypothetical protein [Gammaproteobacteria bacterium]
MKARWPKTPASRLALLGAALLALGILFDQDFYPSYLYAFVCWTGLSLGSLSLVMVHHLTGGSWGVAVRRPLAAAATPLPIMGLLFIPLALSLHEIYVWARPEAVAADPLLHEKQWYLNVTFFLLRAAGYFVLWSGLMLWLERLRTNDGGDARRVSAGGLMALVLTMSFAAVDWIMSLTPEWYSTLFGLSVGISQALGAMALTVICALLLSRRESASANISTDRLHDLGNLLLMFALIWMYLFYMEFITVWIADGPEEITWYLPRIDTSWSFLSWALPTLCFIAPLPMLLSRRAKRNWFMLGVIATIMLCGYFANVFWLIMPAFREHGFAIRWADLGAFLGVGALWLAVFFWRLTATVTTSARVTGREALGHG